MGNDTELLANNIMMDLAFLSMSWKHVLGRPTYTIIASSNFVGKANVYCLANSKLSTLFGIK